MLINIFQLLYSKIQRSIKFNRKWTCSNGCNYTSTCKPDYGFQVLCRQINLSIIHIWKETMTCESWLSATVHVHCNKEVRPGTEVRYVYSYVHTMSLSSETDGKELQNSWCAPSTLMLHWSQGVWYRFKNTKNFRSISSFHNEK